MKLIKVISIIIAVILIGSLCACEKQSQSDNVSFSANDFDLRPGGFSKNAEGDNAGFSREAEQTSENFDAESGFENGNIQGSGEQVDNSQSNIGGSLNSGQTAAGNKNTATPGGQNGNTNSGLQNNGYSSSGETVNGSQNYNNSGETGETKKNADNSSQSSAYSSSNKSGNGNTVTPGGQNGNANYSSSDKSGNGNTATPGGQSSNTNSGLQNNGYSSSGQTASNSQNYNNSGKAGGTVTSSDVYSDTQNEDYEETFVPMQIPSRKNAYRLSNTYSKIKSGERLNVVYYGGSVTSGTGASDDEKTSYRALTTAYLKGLSSGVTETNLCIGGTGTYLAAARFEHDVISANPDLLIIEFAINDVYSGIKTEQSKANLEYMINRLFDSNPYADIIIALVTNKSYYGFQYDSYKAHVEVANHYNIPVVDLGGEMYNRLKGWYDGFQNTDSVHPNDTGHKLYADIMIDAFKELFADKPAAAHKMPANKHCKNGYSKLTNTVATSIQKDGNWSLYSWFNNTDYEKTGSPLRSSSLLKSLYPKYLAPDDVGKTLTFTFTGNSFGFIGSLKNGASLRIVIDDDSAKTLDGSSNTALIEYPVFNNLENKEHSVTVTVKGDNPYAAIASFVTTEK